MTLSGSIMESQRLIQQHWAQHPVDLEWARAPVKSIRADPEVRMGVYYISSEKKAIDAVGILRSGCGEVTQYLKKAPLIAISKL